MDKLNVLLENKIFTIPNFLTNNECDKFIMDITNKQDITNFTSVSNFKNDKYVDEILSYYFYGKIENIFKQNLINQLQIVKPNNLIMTGMYNENQQFGLHTDTGLYYDKQNNLKSRFTLLIYLNDDFTNGETSFYDDNFTHILDVIPQKGMSLLFDIDMWHKGNIVIGNTKFWIGCEIIGKF